MSLPAGAAGAIPVAGILGGLFLPEAPGEVGHAGQDDEGDDDGLHGDLQVMYWMPVGGWEPQANPKTLPRTTTSQESTQASTRP